VKISSIKPACRWQPAFYPFKKEKTGKRLIRLLELSVKGPLFGCRMCGNCLLQETAFICPMECPKGLRNGPCGGMTAEKNCYVDETRKCIWFCIYKHAEKTGRQEKLIEILPPLDWEKAGTETWGDVVRQIRKVGTMKFFSGIMSADKEKKSKTWDSVFSVIRQPEWWQGDSDYHAPAYSEPASELERRLKSGEFVVTAEVTPPAGAGTDKLINDIRLVKEFVTAINFTDASSAKPGMSSMVCSKIACGLKAEPVFQVAARDITRTSLQNAMTGINELGIRNVFCITGDSPKIGCSPTGCMNTPDLDSVQMLWILRRMRDDGIYLDGRKLKSRPKYFLGAAASPQTSEPALQAIRDHKKVNAGAQFFQTNIVFDIDKIDAWLEQLDKRNITGKVYILIGIAPLKSLKVAHYLNTKIPGVSVPDGILKRLEKAGDGAPEEGIRIALEQVELLRNKKGINGIHIMPLGWEESVPRILMDSGLSRNKNPKN
jgi:methylenetetrahydrofolate reductase (NADPH)